METNILDVKHLTTRFPTAKGDALPVNGVSLTVKRAASRASWANPAAEKA